MKYNDQIPVFLPELFAGGQSIVEVCEMLQISRQTFYRWQKLHPEFKEAAELGIDRSQAWWLRLGREGAGGLRKINALVWKTNMANRFGWRDKQEPSGGPDGQLAPIINMTREEYTAARRAMLEEDDC